MSILNFLKDVARDIKRENTPTFNSEKFVLESSSIAQALIDRLKETHPNHSTFDQAGIENGSEIVANWIKHEWPLAVEHLLYMIHSADIPYPRDRMLRLHEIAKEKNIKNKYSLENLASWKPDRLKWVYNRP